MQYISFWISSKLSTFNKNIVEND